MVGRSKALCLLVIVGLLSLLIPPCAAQSPFGSSDIHAVFLAQGTQAIGSAAWIFPPHYQADSYPSFRFLLEPDFFSEAFLIDFPGQVRASCLFYIVE